MGNLLLETGQEAEDLGNGADSMKKASDHATEIVHQLRVISDEVHQAVETIAQQTKQTNASRHKKFVRLLALFQKLQKKQIC